jgi:hypothetical protein
MMVKKIKKAMKSMMRTPAQGGRARRNVGGTTYYSNKKKKGAKGKSKKK